MEQRLDIAVGVACSPLLSEHDTLGIKQNLSDCNQSGLRLLDQTSLVWLGVGFNAVTFWHNIKISDKKSCIYVMRGSCMFIEFMRSKHLDHCGRVFPSTLLWMHPQVSLIKMLWSCIEYMVGRVKAKQDIRGSYVKHEPKKDFGGFSSLCIFLCRVFASLHLCQQVVSKCLIYLVRLTTGK
jgi:hypothetical protein